MKKPAGRSAVGGPMGVQLLSLRGSRIAPLLIA